MQQTLITKLCTDWGRDTICPTIKPNMVTTHPDHSHENCWSNRQLLECQNFRNLESVRSLQLRRGLRYLLWWPLERLKMFTTKPKPRDCPDSLSYTTLASPTFPSSELAQLLQPHMVNVPWQDCQRHSLFSTTGGASRLPSYRNLRPQNPTQH